MKGFRDIALSRETGRVGGKEKEEEKEEETARTKNNMSPRNGGRHN
jgi:hypothetical protein